MLLAFIDETSDIKFREYLGFSIATVNARFYGLLKEKAQNILRDVDWDPEVEFKGSYLFSASKGCPDVVVERRVEAAHRLLDLNVAKANSRMKFYYGSLMSREHAADYLGRLPELLHRALPAAPHGAGKDLLLLTCDERSDVSPDALHATLKPAAERRGYTLVERVVVSRSSFDTVGLMYADLVGYLAARIDTISTDAELFEGLTSEQLTTNGKLRKLRSSTELIAKVKCLDLFRAAETSA